jgi:hypothetical protein
MQRLVTRNDISAPPSLVELSKTGQIQISSLLNNNGEADKYVIERLALPAAGTPRPQLSRIDAQPNIQPTVTLNVSSAGPHSLETLPSPVPTQSRAAAASISQQSFPQTTTHASTSPKTLHSAARDTEKCRDTEQCPSDSCVCIDNASIIRAPKRKFQSLLDETHFRGVSNPTEHSRKLTSKRNSQIVAEQGRRNRMKSALQELATLLPTAYKNDNAGEKDSSQDGDPQEGDKGGGGGGGTAWAQHGVATIASMVESATEYIKQLKKDLDDANEHVRVAEKKIRMRHSSGVEAP